MEKHSKSPPVAEAPAFATSVALDAIDARSLMKGRKEALLLLDGETYRLRITGNNKLILTK
jgi:hemin uptake protein HemP